MRTDWHSLDADILKNLYRAKEEELESALLTGRSWDEVSMRRKTLIEMSAALHAKLQSGNDNAEYPTAPSGEE